MVGLSKRSFPRLVPLRLLRRARAIFTIILLAHTTLPAYSAVTATPDRSPIPGDGTSVAGDTLRQFRYMALPDSLSSVEEETRLKSVEYIFQSAQAAHSVGARKIVVHSGSCSKMTREEATELAKDTLKKAQERLDSEGLSEIIICPETMGKVNQLGTLEEVLELCGVDERFLPTVDFGHLYARTHGGITCREDYAKMLDLIADKLGTERLNSMHIHFSRIEFTAGGEKRHLTFEDTQFGPEYQPLMQEIKQRGMTPSIICESAGTQAEDAAEMKRYYESL